MGHSPRASLRAGISQTLGAPSTDFVPRFSASLSIPLSTLLAPNFPQPMAFGDLLDISEFGGPSFRQLRLASRSCSQADFVLISRHTDYRWFVASMRPAARAIEVFRERRNSVLILADNQERATAKAEYAQTSGHHLSCGGLYLPRAHSLLNDRPENGQAIPQLAAVHGLPPVRRPDDRTRWL
jgi:hypothetical protein